MAVIDYATRKISSGESTPSILLKSGRLAGKYKHNLQALLTALLIETLAVTEISQRLARRFRQSVVLSLSFARYQEIDHNWQLSTLIKPHTHSYRQKQVTKLRRKVTKQKKIEIMPKCLKLTILTSIPGLSVDFCLWTVVLRLKATGIHWFRAHQSNSVVFGRLTVVCSQKSSVFNIWMRKRTPKTCWKSILQQKQSKWRSFVKMQVLANLVRWRTWKRNRESRRKRQQLAFHTTVHNPIENSEQQPSAWDRYFIQVR